MLRIKTVSSLPQLHQLKVGDDIFVGKKTQSGFMTLEGIPEIMNDLWILSAGTAVGTFYL
ncbi:hypothetical protein O9992_24760 [Vibrio lentus]|nr:hypothetical protein [Vibrio lentus]